MDYPEEMLLRGIRKSLLQWYDFEPNSQILFIGEAENALAEMLAEKAQQMICVRAEKTSDLLWQQEHLPGFDYIVSIGGLELLPHPEEMLTVWRGLLKPKGHLLLGLNNRLGIRYFCGDRDPYTGRSFDGVEHYRRAYVRKEDAFRGRCYSQAEIKRFLQTAGWNRFQFYSVFPDLYNPCLLFAEDYLPNEDLSNRVSAMYNYPDSVFLEEESLYGSLIDNGMFHQMANAYLVECAPDGNLSNVQHVTSSAERGRDNAFLTVIRRTGMVEKRAVYPEGTTRLKALLKHNQDLSAHGIQVVNAKLENSVCTMAYINAEVGQVYLKRLLQTNPEKFLQELDHFRDLILQSSDIVKPDSGDGQGAILRYGYVDMVPLNSFHQNGTFIFYDQEFCVENYPANVIITRMIASLYTGNLEFEKIIPIHSLFERYGLTAKLELWRKMEWEFLSALRNEKELRSYNERRRRNGDLLHANRHRMNYSDEDYQRLFVDIFCNADTRKLILFGSGMYAQKFLELYGQDYPVYAIVDNNKEKWGQKLKGIPIQSPELLEQMQCGEYKILICIKNYVSVMKQLDTLGLTEYSIFDAGKGYPRKRKPIQLQESIQDTPKKKYHVGYIAGVFDLFHVGHLNMFKRAKEQCDYLIAGVVTDEGVRKFKGTEPFIPFEERIEMIRSCRYVDEAIEIPFHYCSTWNAYQMYRFDCQFSGSDYAGDPEWLAAKKFLEAHGAQLVFFPYTQSTSSTKLKSLIDSKLL